MQAGFARACPLPTFLRDLAVAAVGTLLAHIFSKESGFTLSSFLTQVRMQKAAELLSDPAAQVAEVAYAVGYEDANYFSKAFRRHFGYSPTRYRVRK